MFKPLKIKKLYLAHPTVVREEVKYLEAEFEKDTGVNLINPFYDVIREDVIALDVGKRKIYEGLHADTIVRVDVERLLESQGILAYMPYVPMVGTVCEMMLSRQFNKFVFIVTPYKNWLQHPWLVYFSDKIFSSFQEFADWLRENDLIE